MKQFALTLALSLCFVLAAAVAMADEGQALYTAKCASCHGADGSKAVMSKPVKGLSQEDVSKMMLGYKAKTYGGTKKATMENLISRLSDDEIKALASYVSKL